MFYSQFILAKKGPLGTIWIAAHLERKLRKNQVADTDIGVSVDSILFPDVPIALRLSSHLLLGVVRIYSRKVNYLFDDCSEALLKIKQAFRSTAVDLPPEESTAPYHSITLPETFDLDDFELPDNDMFKGNYVDHHISTRDQITLQDTMEGVVYSTSQFGLDERFGDGDTSQAGLDLEEELLLENAAVTGHDQVSENDAQASVEPVPHLETYANHERMAGSSEDMPLNGTINKVPDIDEDFEVTDYADAPCTPGLVEPNVSSVKEGLGCDDHLELEENSLTELMGKTDSITGEPISHREDAMELSLGENVNHDTLLSMPAEDNNLSVELEINQASAGEFLSEAVTTKHIPADESVFTPNELPNLEEKGEVVSCNSKQTMCSMDQVNGECEVLGVRSLETNNVENGCDIEVPHSNGNATITATLQSIETSSAQDCVNVESQECPGLVNCEISNDNDKNNEQTVSTSSCFLRQCNSQTSELNVESLSLNKAEREEGHVSGNSTKVQGEEYHVSDGIQSVEMRMSEQTLNEENLEDEGREDKQLDDLISRDNQCEDLNTSMTSELPAPEKLLSAPLMLLDERHDMLIETPEKEVQEEGGGRETGTNITGRKRPFSESALTVQSLNSVDSFGVARSKGTVESIPDDDDLLSSILVGRKSSFMKIKPSPPAPSKRARSSASRPSALKRKVLMDDSMVLHGDTIRQQLTSTEDIRRLRKKAPCTHTEILMIQRQFLQVEIFNEPVLTGMSVELTHLHNEEFDLSRVRVCENDDNTQASLELVDIGNSGCKNANEGGENEGGINVVTSTNDAVGQPLESVENVILQVEDRLGSLDINFQNSRNCIAEEMDFRSSVLDNLGESVEMESYRKNLGEWGEISELPTDTVDQSAPTVGCMQMDAPNLLADKIAIQLGDEVHFMNNMGNVAQHEGVDAVDQSAEKRVLDTTELRPEEEIPSEDTKISASDERVDGCTPNDDVDGSRANAPALDGGCSNLNSVNVDQNLEDAENDKNRVFNDDVSLVVSSGCISDKDQNPNTLCDDESKMDPTCSVGLEGDVKSSSINHGDHVAGLESDFRNFMEDTQDSLHQVTLGDCDDIQVAPFPNDTEFLNVDDDEIGEDDDEGMPNTEDTPRLLENTGWSTRTRAVARYLQTLFDKEAEHGRKGVSIDSLLAGKTRKEASRMFFETLVLKTRDYVQVEQPLPFDSIKIKPRSKLMISDF